MIDSHCHLLSSEYDDVEKEINKAIASGVNKMIINGYDANSSLEAVSLSEKYECVYAAVGIGPEEVNKVKEEDISVIEKLLKHKKVVAIGEIGLDYYWIKENKDIQIKIFKKMLSLARKYNLPVIVHNRKATADVYNLLKEYNVSGILHCFSGSTESAKEFIKLGFLIGIGGVVTFKNAKEIKEVVKNIPIKYISLETDSPYLTPEPYRGKKNNPAYLSYIVEAISNIKQIDKDDVINVTTTNVMSKFDL